MKRSSILSKRTGWAFTIACLSLVTLLGACKKDPVEIPVGEIKVQAVNAIESSDPQDFYANGVKLNSLDAITYGDYSGYLTSTSEGKIINFADEGSTTSNAVTQISGFSIGGYYTFFYTTNPDNDDQPGILALQDDMTPDPAKAKVRFVHLNSALATATVDVKIKDATASLAKLRFINPSQYQSIEAGAQFTVTADGVTTPLEIDDANLVAGKNYTIWLDGSKTELNGHVVIQTP